MLVGGNSDQWLSGKAAWGQQGLEAGPEDATGCVSSGHPRARPSVWPDPTVPAERAAGGPRRGPVLTRTPTWGRTFSSPLLPFLDLPVKDLFCWPEVTFILSRPSPSSPRPFPFLNGLGTPGYTLAGGPASATPTQPSPPPRVASLGKLTTPPACTPTQQCRFSDSY